MNVSVSSINVNMRFADTLSETKLQAIVLIVGRRYIK